MRKPEVDYSFAGKKSQNHKTLMSLYGKDHQALLRALLKHHVKFLIIGGHAAIYYGVNRTTGDFDKSQERRAESMAINMTWRS